MKKISTFLIKIAAITICFALSISLFSACGAEKSNSTITFEEGINSNTVTVNDADDSAVWEDAYTTNSENDASFDKARQCGKNLMYTYDSGTRTLTISGNGDMYDYSSVSAPWKGFSIETLIIEEGVTSIGNKAFYKCDTLYSITLPDSLKSIGRDVFTHTAFYYNEENWEQSVLYIGNWLISAVRHTARGNQYNRVGEYTVKDGTVGIAGNAFYGCDKLTTVAIPDGVETIGQGAFAKCFGLNTIILPDSVTRIEESAFFDCGFYQITLPQHLTVIEDRTFDDCDHLESIIIPDGVTKLGSGAFSDCYHLTSIQIPASVTEIGYGLDSAGKDLVLSVYDNSYALEYAKENGFDYVIISE